MIDTDHKALISALDKNRPNKTSGHFSSFVKLLVFYMIQEVLFNVREGTFSHFSQNKEIQRLFEFFPRGGNVVWRSLLDYYDVISVLVIRAKLAFCLSRS